MPTIANMPGADVPVTINDPNEGENGLNVTYNVNLIVLLAETQSAECKVKYGHFKAQNMPSIETLDKKYHLYYYFDGPVRTWEDCAAALRHLYNLCSEHVKAHS